MVGEIARILKCRDYYEVLQLPRLVDDAAVRKAKRDKSLLTHPDKAAGAIGANEAFQRVFQASEVLADTCKRHAYDATLAHHSALRSNSGGSATPATGAGAAQFNGSSASSAKPEEQPDPGRPSCLFACGSCGSSHRGFCVNRPVHAARWCSACGEYHAASEGDGWSESSGFFLLPELKFYMCCDGSIYDITNLARCNGYFDGASPNQHLAMYRFGTASGRRGGSQPSGGSQGFKTSGVGHSKKSRRRKG